MTVAHIPDPEQRVNKWLNDFKQRECEPLVLVGRLPDGTYGIEFDCTIRELRKMETRLGWLLNELETTTKCTCHERDSSYTCEYCKSQGYYGHMETPPR